MMIRDKHIVRFIRISSMQTQRYIKEEKAEKDNLLLLIVLKEHHQNNLVLYHHQTKPQG